MSQPPFPHSPSHPHVAYPYPHSSPSSSARLKHSNDDLKYIQKYKDLKQKVKDVELDNDRLHIKVLKTKKNIHRLRIERAILYERLAAMPSSDISSQPLQQQQPAHHHQQVQLQYSSYSPDPQLQVSRTHPDAQLPKDLPHPGFPLDVHSQIHPDKNRHHLDPPQRPYSGPESHPIPPPHYSHARPQSPVRLQHPVDPYPPPSHVQQPHNPMDIDRPPLQPPRSRRQQIAHANSGPAREGDRNGPLPVSLPPPPHTLPYPPSNPNVHQGSSTHSPHLERDERGQAPPDAAYQQYSGPPVHRTRERDYERERAHLGGPGLPPIRTHSDARHQSPRPPSPSSHNGYAHPMQHPFSSSDERGWEREHDPPQYPMRGDDRIRDRERDRDRREMHDHSPSNGYREPGPPPRRFDGPPHGNGSTSAHPSPPTSYVASRRPSLGHVHGHADSASSRSQERERDSFERRDREYPQYDYVRRQDRDVLDEEGGQGQAQVHGQAQGQRRRSLAEMEDRERQHDHRAQQKQRRTSQDGVGGEEKRGIRRDRERDLEREREVGAEKERDDRDIVPRVREGELME